MLFKEKQLLGSPLSSSRDLNLPNCIILLTSGWSSLVYTQFLLLPNSPYSDLKKKKYSFTWREHPCPAACIRLRSHSLSVAWLTQVNHIIEQQNWAMSRESGSWRSKWDISLSRLPKSASSELFNSRSQNTERDQDRNMRVCYFISNSEISITLSWKCVFISRMRIAFAASVESILESTEHIQI